MRPPKEIAVRYLNLCLASAAGAIVGLVAYDLAASQKLFWGIGCAAVSFAAIYVASRLVFHPEDRDPTIRPSSVARKREPEE